MTFEHPEGYISIVGTNLLQPITTLFEELEKVARGPNEVQASGPENGFATSVAALTVFLLESTIQRLKYRRGDNPSEKPIPYIRLIYPDSPWVDKLEELFIVRNVIVHNHIWEAKIYWDEDMKMRLSSAEFNKEFGGNKAFYRVLDKEKRKTKLLGINLFPNRISHDDAVIVLINATDFLLFLENEDRNYVYISPQPIMYQERSMTFVDFVKGLQLRFTDG